MKATETKTTHSQQQRATKQLAPVQTPDHTFTPTAQAESIPFFLSSTARGVQAQVIASPNLFFQPTRIPALQRSCAACKAKVQHPSANVDLQGTHPIQRIPAFESEAEVPVQPKYLIQRIPAFESEVEPPVQRQPLIQRQTTSEAETEPEETTSGDTERQAQFISGAMPPEDNAANPGALQARLTIGHPNDPFEQEADAVADQVVTMPQPRPGVVPGLQTQVLHKQITRLSSQSAGAVRPKQLQRLPQVQKEDNGRLTASNEISGRLNRSRGGGSELDDDTQSEMEGSFGADFSHVRIHTGSNAAQLSQELGAKAFTHGSDIYFNQGQYNPHSTEGKHLLAHELTHTVQQGASIQRKVHITTSAAPTIQLLPDVIKRGVNWLAERTIPGYDLLNVILGKNLITGATVARSGINLIKGYMRLSPIIGSILLSELEETETLTEAGQWVEGKVAAFGIDFNDIARRLKLMWDEMSIWKGIDGNIQVFKKHLGPVMGKFLAFSGVVMTKVKELRLEGALRLVGATDLLQALKQDPNAFKRAADDPAKVLKAFMSGALKQGFSNFKDNFITHFKNALLGWLFGKAAEMGVQMPKKLDIAGLFSLIAQLVGATYTQIRTQVVKRLGPKGEMIVSKLEQTVAFIKDLVTKGPIALWERVKEYLSNLKEIFFSKIATLVSTEIIKAAVTKLLSMLNPAGAIVQLALTLYRVIKFFIDNWETIKSVAQGILNAIGIVALNQVGQAAAFVEKVLATGMKLIISFLARIFGLSGIADKVKTLIKKISDPVQKAIGKVIDWIVAQGKKIFGKGKKTTKNSIRVKDEVKTELKSKLSDEKTPEQIASLLISTKQKYRLKGLKSLESKADETGKFQIFATASKGKKTGQGKLHLPTLTPRELDFREPQTVLIATLNSVPLGTGKFRSGRGKHAEDRLIETFKANWTSLRKQGRNLLTVRITRSPCSACTPKLAKLKNETNQRGGGIYTLSILLKMASDYQGMLKFDKNLKLFRRLRQAGIKIGTFSILKELSKFGLKKSDLTKEQIAKIEVRAKQVQELIRKSNIKV